VQYVYNSASFVKEKTILMPPTNPEGIFLNRCSNTFWTGNEGTGTMQNTFLYAYSLKSIHPDTTSTANCKVSTPPQDPEPDTPPPTPDPTPELPPDEPENPQPEPEVPQNPEDSNETSQEVNAPAYSLVVKTPDGEIIRNETVLVNGVAYETDDSGRIQIPVDPDSTTVQVTTTDGQDLQLSDKVIITNTPQVGGAESKRFKINSTQIAAISTLITAATTTTIILLRKY
jgi:type IV secretory pathway VirB10-like protein